MKTIVVNEWEEAAQSVPSEGYFFYLSNHAVTQCCGCWSCWWRTPGRCVYKDLDLFYHEYITSDRVVFYAKNVRGFVSGAMKSLFDRMIPLFLPYTTYKTGESMHVTRYERYPDIEFYYDDSDMSKEDIEIFENYIHRVFYQFYSKNIVVSPLPAQERMA
jgi:multimeric flavodoxin WrbA